jgi:two-component system nitrogen regulation sensor histidine kinase GlnL
MEDGALWASLPVPAVLIDAGDRIAGVNVAGEAFLNASAKALIGLPVEDRLRFDTDLAAAFARVRRDGGPVFVNRVGAGQGTGAACDLRIAPVVDGEGAVLMLIEPRHLADRLGEAQGVRSAARSAIGMAEMLAHEIKNPLAGITGAAQLLAMELTGEDRALTDLIVAESRRIVALLDQVEQFGNLRPPARAVVNVHDLLDRARKSAEVGFAAGMRIVEEYDPSLPPTFVDADQIIQVFLNLIRNATEAAGGTPGTVRLRTFYDHALRLRRADGSDTRLPLQVEVVDDGPGIAPDIAAQVFEPFISGRENGTGLGLALVSKIIADHDGWIAVESAPGCTRFRISLPVAPDEKG